MDDETKFWVDSLVDRLRQARLEGHSQDQVLEASARAAENSNMSRKTMAGVIAVLAYRLAMGDL